MKTMPADRILTALIPANEPTFPASYELLRIFGEKTKMKEAMLVPWHSTVKSLERELEPPSMSPCRVNGIKNGLAAPSRCSRSVASGIFPDAAMPGRNWRKKIRP
jgi:hypothetical protein